MKMVMKLYDGNKYSSDSKKIKEIILDGVEEFRTVMMRKDQAQQLGCDEFDPYGSYLWITFEDGTQSMYRNSYVDLFKY